MARRKILPRSEWWWQKKMTIMMRRRSNHNELEDLENRKNDTIFPNNDPAYKMTMTRMTVRVYSAWTAQICHALDLVLHWQLECSHEMVCMLRKLLECNCWSLNSGYAREIGSLKKGCCLESRGWKIFRISCGGTGPGGGGRDKQKAREKIAEQRIWGRIFAERLERDRENFLLGKQKDLFKSKK